MNAPAPRTSEPSPLSSPPSTPPTHSYASTEAAIGTVPTWTAKEENCLSLYYPGTPTPGETAVVHLEVLLRGVFQDEVLGYRAFSIEEIVEKGSLPRDWYDLLAPVLPNATEASKGRGVVEASATAGKVLVEVDFADEGLVYLSSHLEVAEGENGEVKKKDEDEDEEEEEVVAVEAKEGQAKAGGKDENRATDKGKKRWSWGKGRAKGKDKSTAAGAAEKKEKNKKKRPLGTTSWPQGRWSPLDRGGLRAHRFDIATASTGNSNICPVCNKKLFITVATLGLASRCYGCSQCELYVHEQCREEAESRLPCYLSGPNGLGRALGEVRVGETVSI